MFPPIFWLGFDDQIFRFFPWILHKKSSFIAQLRFKYTKIEIYLIFYKFPFSCARMTKWIPSKDILLCVIFLTEQQYGVNHLDEERR